MIKADCKSNRQTILFARQFTENVVMISYTVKPVIATTRGSSDERCPRNNGLECCLWRNRIGNKNCFTSHIGH